MYSHSLVFNREKPFNRKDENHQHWSKSKQIIKMIYECKMQRNEAKVFPLAEALIAPPPPHCFKKIKKKTSTVQKCFLLDPQRELIAAPNMGTRSWFPKWRPSWIRHLGFLVVWLHGALIVIPRQGLSVDIYRLTILWFTCGIPSKPSARRACHVGYKGSKSQGVQNASSFRCKILVFLFLYGFGRAPFYQIQFLTTRQLAGWVTYVFNKLVRCLLV